MTKSSASWCFVPARVVAWLGDEPFPGTVQVELVDGDGRVWVFADKAPMFDAGDVLRRDSVYPMDIEIACTVLHRVETPAGGRLVVSTAEPWGIETANGQHEFSMRPDQVRHQRESPDR